MCILCDAVRRGDAVREVAFDWQYCHGIGEPPYAKAGLDGIFDDRRGRSIAYGGMVFRRLPGFDVERIVALCAAGQTVGLYGFLTDCVCLGYAVRLDGARYVVHHGNRQVASLTREELPSLSVVEAFYAEPASESAVTCCV